MGKKRGILLFSVLLLEILFVILPGDSLFAAGSVDVISNGQSWFFCNATGASAIHAHAVPNYGLVPLSSINSAPAGYPCLLGSSCSVSFDKIRVRMVPDARYCDADQDGFSDNKESSLLNDVRCLFDGSLDSFNYVTSPACTACDRTKPTTTDIPDCPGGVCNPPDGSGGLKSKTDCTNKLSYVCLGTAIEPEKADSCAQGVDNDKDGKTSCDDPDCSFCDGTNCKYPPTALTGLDCSKKTENCTNGIDDDGNTLIDCADPACVNYARGLCQTDNATGSSATSIPLPNSYICYTGDRADYFGECCAGGLCDNLQQVASGNPRYDEVRDFLAGTPLYTLSTGDNFAGAAGQKKILKDFVDIRSFGPADHCQNAYFGDGWMTPAITDWSSFATFDIDVLINDPLSLTSITIEQQGSPPVAYTALARYSLNGFKPYRWHHLRLPLQTLVDGGINVASMKNMKLTFNGDASCKANSEIAVDYISLAPSDVSGMPQSRYCAGDFKTWIQGLDPEKIFLDHSGNPSINPHDNQTIYATYQYACNQHLAYGWTGTKCCGTDSNEYWADSFYAGCWNSFTLNAGDRANDTLNDNSKPYDSVIYDAVANQHGKFFACGYGDGLVANTSFHGVFPEVALNYSSQIDFVPSCTVKGKYFCDGLKWSDESDGPIDSRNRNNIKYSPNISMGNPSCCPRDYCYNGTRCIQGTKDALSLNLDGSLFYPNKDAAETMCVIDSSTGVASWAPVSRKMYWDGLQYGYCANSLNCWNVTTNRAPAGTCIGEGNFTQDHYCKAGSWTTRTSLVASYLYTLAGTGNFVLFCDTPSHVANIPDAFSQSSEENNFCIIHYTDNGKERVVVGASLNSGDTGEFMGQLDSARKNLNEPPFRLSTSTPVCNPSATQTYQTLAFCTDDDLSNNVSFYYDDAHKIVLFTDTDESLLAPPSLSDQFLLFLNSLFSKTPGASDDQKIIKSILGFGSRDRVYIQKKGAVLLSAYEEKRKLSTADDFSTALVIEYQNLYNTTDVPKLFSSIDQPTDSYIHSDLSTSPVGYQRMYLLRQGVSADDLWLQLTAQLRLASFSLTPSSTTVTAAPSN